LGKHGASAINDRNMSHLPSPSISRWLLLVRRLMRLDIRRKHKGRNAVEAELGEIQTINKHIDRPHRIVRADIVIQYRGKQRALTAIRPSTKRVIQSHHKS
jgi:hypothetical protein